MRTNSNHLHMTLLQLALYLVEVMGVELVPRVGFDNIILFPLFNGRRVLFLVVGWWGWRSHGSRGHGWDPLSKRGMGSGAGAHKQGDRKNSSAWGEDPSTQCLI